MAGKEPIDEYLTTGSAEESNFRSVILFGRNTASYKFALAKALFDLARLGKDSVTLEQLANPYTRHLVEHIKKHPKQSTNRSNKFLDTCEGFAKGSTSYDQLISTAVKLGFNNVLDAFHMVNRGNVPIKFFEKDFRGGAKRLILTDEVFELANSDESSNILQEIESRWNLVETAWETGVSANLLAYDEDTQRIVLNDNLRRQSVTSVRGALNDYQKGHCFYCFDSISATVQQEDEEPKLVLSDEPSRVEYAVVSLDQEEPESELCDVDHFCPHMLSREMRGINLDGVWNLVLACKDCNRGAGGKFAHIPEEKYLERLCRRNEYLIVSHHPLRETLISQTGASPRERWRFLKRVDERATELLTGAKWSIEQRQAAVF
ncbi:HNH endonuclease domain-containing protein [Adlercreutzia sp. ZJ154]|uniref:HNH endonuclease domain-containing protein n=1 Tax=Adlercreutzia sp. ZJ154 TaxID=2709790 RepID=UPI0013EDC057|nr:HNH endonuclease domain-containing protein [Adlercreutzia sp. ZJ154]